ncbi:PHP domain-containing protein [Moraxella sp. VT-16-12]|uniref:PHP domain-containing protein n=1 Tax=Moraxella sp. VT-16-12 TaxID=2014877 RepID=UPI000B7C5C00|nr:PHP domain-containing protein [Moraxella sp. VT-16-12]TWV83892.1 PHP domain-containing protein [Moraxella sp. VT-16-12]
MIDLHSHSTCSDGTYSPQELVLLAKNAGISTFALTDHDTILGLDDAHQKARQLGVRLINGVEISCHHTLFGGYGKNQAIDKVIHVVALDFLDKRYLGDKLTALQHSREYRGRSIIAKLATLLDYDETILVQQVLNKVNHNPKAIGRAHIAQVLFELGLTKSIQDAFDKYLADNKPAYVAIDAMSMTQTVQLIHDCGGLAVLAHPTRYGLSATRTRRLIAEFADMGGDAVELPNSEPVSTRAMIDRCVKEHDLLVSVGSDFHGANMPWRKLGKVATIKPEQVGVWERFRPSSDC